MPHIEGQKTGIGRFLVFKVQFEWKSPSSPTIMELLEVFLTGEGSFTASKVFLTRSLITLLLYSVVSLLFGGFIVILGWVISSLLLSWSFSSFLGRFAFPSECWSIHSNRSIFLDFDI